MTVFTGALPAVSVTADVWGQQVVDRFNDLDTGKVSRDGLANLGDAVTPTGVNDTAAVNTAFAAFAAAGGGRLFIPRGNWKFTGSTGLSLVGTSNPIHIEAAPGCVFDFTGSTAATALLLGGTNSVTSAVLGADVAQWAETITCALAVVPGDIIKIQSSDVFDVESAQPKGELCEVMSSAAGVITLKSGLFDSYLAATTTVYLMQMPRVSVEGLEIVRNSNHAGLQVAYARDVLLGGLVGSGARERLHYLNTCYGATVDNCSGTDFWFSGSGTSYGLILGSTQHAVQRGNTYRGGRHAVSHGGTFPCRDVTVIGGTFDNHHSSGQAAFDFHSNAENVRLAGVTVLNGLNSHASNLEVTGGTFLGQNRRAVEIYSPRNCQYVRLRNVDVRSAPGWDGVCWFPRNSNAGLHTTDLVEIEGFIRAGAVGVSVAPVTVGDANSAITRLVIRGDVESGGASAAVSIAKTSTAGVALAETELDGRFRAPGGHGILTPGASGNVRVRGTVSTGLTVGKPLDLQGFVNVTVENATLIGTNTPYRNSFTTTGRLTMTNVTIDGASSVGGIYTAGPTEALIQNVVRLNTTGTPTLPTRTLEAVNAAGKVTGSGTAAPVAGTWAVGDEWRNTAPAAAGKRGWVCTVAGTPGTWKPWGVIDA